MWDFTFSHLLQWWFPGFWCRADSSVDANVSEKHTIFFFRDEDGDVVLIKVFPFSLKFICRLQFYNYICSMALMLHHLRNVYGRNICIVYEEFKSTKLKVPMNDMLNIKINLFLSLILYALLNQGREIQTDTCILLMLLSRWVRKGKTWQPLKNLLCDTEWSYGAGFRWLNK